MSSDTRERILKVASELFTEQGYEATSLRQIADRLGFTKAALYYHFQGKDQIFAALLAPADDLVAELVGRLEAADGLEGWAEALEWVTGQVFVFMDFFKLVQRNRTVVERDRFEDIEEHHQMHARIERAAQDKAASFTEHVRMIAALGAVTGFDDWAPDLMLAAAPETLLAELVATIRDILHLPQRSTVAIS